MRHELDLLENATDSLNEALRKFGEGQDGEHRAYKFAILHFAHFFELLFKYHVWRAHPLLIYKRPFSASLKTEPTIGLWEAVQFLRNEGKAISGELSKDLEWIKKLRNDIEHFRFTMDVPEVRRTVGRLIRATNEFNTTLNDVDLKAKMPTDCLELFNTLADEYKANLENAQADAREDSDDGEGHACPSCGEPETAALVGKNLSCKLCRDTDEMVACFNCGDEFPRSSVSVWNDEHAIVDYVCEGCEEYIMSR